MSFGLVQDDSPCGESWDHTPLISHLTVTGSLWMRAAKSLPPMGFARILALPV